MAETPFPTEAAARGFVFKRTDPDALAAQMNAGPVGGDAEDAGQVSTP